MDALKMNSFDLTQSLKHREKHTGEKRGGHRGDAYEGSVQTQPGVMTSSMALSLKAGKSGGHVTSHPKESPTTVFRGGHPFHVEKLGKGSAGFTDWAVRDDAGQVSGYATTRGSQQPTGEELQLPHAH